MNAENIRSNSHRRRGKASERGQVLVLFVLISLTIFLIAVLSTAVGQMMVRRHYAQLVADAAAWAGGNKQAEGMNMISRYNQKSANLLIAIQASMQVPYMDDNGTTWERHVTGGLWNDWAGDTLENYQKIFDGINNFITATNLAYASPPFIPATTPGFAPPRAAKRVIDANFANTSQAIFKPSDLSSHGVVFDPGKTPWELVKLTDKREKKLDSWMHGYTYVPYANHYSVTCPPGPYCVNVPCCAAKAAMALGYGIALPWFRLRWLWDPIKYSFGRYYDQPDGQDVRFTYYVEVTQTPVIMGKNFFTDVPTIIAVASAKPYGGYLGKEVKKTWTGWYEEEGGKEASPTYKAKLIPVRQATVGALAVQRGFSGGAMRWTSVTH